MLFTPPVSALAPLALLTTAATPANLEALAAFTAAYDNYLLIGWGLKPSATQDGLRLRMANAGIVDSTAKYFTNTQVESTTALTVGGTEMNVSSFVQPGAGGLSFALHLMGANSATDAKAAMGKAAYLNAVTPGYRLDGPSCIYVGAAVSGVRLYWSGGNTFAAGGSLRIFGFN